MNAVLERIRRSLLICLAPAALLAFAPTPVSAAKVDPYAKDNGTWITIGGTVESVGPN
jgi:hypothetical protein